MSVKRYTLALAVFAAPVVATADDAATEELVITAPTGEFLQPVQVIEDEELLLKRATTLGETLANEPGISSTAYGKGAGRPVIRGQAGPRIQVLKDSIATLDVSSLSPDHNPTVEPLLVDRIEVVRGPATLAYGSAAVGGVVNVSEGRIPSDAEAAEFGGSVEVRGDTAAEARAVVGRLDGRVGQLGWHLDASTAETENYDIAGFATADPDERPADEPKGVQPNSWTESDSYSGGVSWLSDSGYIGVSVSQYETEYGLVGEEASIDGGPFVDMEETRIDVRGEYELQGFLNRVRFGFANNDYDHIEFEEPGEPGTIFDNEEWEARVELGHGEIAGMTGAFGLQLNDREFIADGEEAFVQPADAERWGLFVVEDLETDWGKFQFGARADNAEMTSSVFDSYDETAYSFAAGFRRPVADSYEFIANLSVSERNPDIEELYSNGVHIATGQYETGLLAQGLSVDKELAKNLELGFARVEGPIQWSVNFFIADYDDYVYQRIVGEVNEEGEAPGPGDELFADALYTQDDAEFYGGEAELQMGLVNSDSYQLDLRLFGDFVKAELDDGSDLPRIPPHRLGAGLTYTRGALASTISAIYHAKQDEISSFETDSFTMLDIDVFYTLPGDRASWELFLKGSNLLDEEARASASFVAAFSQLPGRNLTAGARLKF